MSAEGDIVNVWEFKKGETIVSGEFAKNVSIGSENLVLNTVGCYGVSIGESLLQPNKNC